MKRTICAVIGVGLLALLGGILVVVGRGDDTAPATAAPKVWSVETARGFGEFPVYWVGQNYKGLPLTQIARMDYPGAAPGKPGSRAWNEVSFTYGDCEIAPGEESCAMPLTIDVRPYCDLRPEQVAPEAKVGPEEVIRGAKVQKIQGNGARVWTANVSIGIAATGEVNPGEVIRNLVRLNSGKPSNPGEALGPPDKIDCP